MKPISYFVSNSPARLNPFALSILSGLLLIAAWPMSPFTPLIFIAWVPLLLLAEQENRIRFYLFSFLAMLIWNTGTTWWIWNSTAAGAIGAIIANCFLMCVPLWGYHIIKSNFGRRIGLFSFACFWMSFEYIHLNWQLSWPWLTLGNVFATHPSWVQWYEYTGTSGGSLWVLLVNILVFELLRSARNKPAASAGSTGGGNSARPIGITVFILLLPVAVSYFIFTQKQSVTTVAPVKANVIIVQPNIDPYNEKFNSGATEEIIQKMITQAESGIDTNTRLVIWPETAVPVAVVQSQLQQNPYYQPIFDFVYRHPRMTLVTGIESYKLYGMNKETATARKNQSDGTYYDAFNASVAITANQPLQFYNKSKLVPGVETLPTWLNWLSAIFEHFGGTTGGYGKDPEASVFKVPGNPYVAAPIICYESIYGEYITNYVRKGANLLTIITNDGWWANTPGHKQHLNYARLHAIETRKWIARSANTGISAVIDDKGQLVETKLWDNAAIIKFNIPALEGETFFVRHGDLISPLAMVFMLILVGWNLWVIINKRLLRRKEKK